MKHHSDQQTVRTNLDLSVLKIQRPFLIFLHSLFLKFSVRSFPHSSILIYIGKVVRWLFAPQKKIKLSFDLWAGAVLLVHYISDAHVLFDVHIRRLNLRFAAASSFWLTMNFAWNIYNSITKFIFLKPK